MPDQRSADRHPTGGGDDDALERMLRAEHLADDGFTAAVMARLPAPRRRAPRTAVLLGAGAMGTAVVLASPATAQLWRLWLALDSSEHGLTALVTLMCLLLVLVGSGVQAAFGD
jgi:hypothetical protein